MHTLTFTIVKAIIINIGSMDALRIARSWKEPTRILRSRWHKVTSYCRGGHLSGDLQLLISS